MTTAESSATRATRGQRPLNLVPPSERRGLPGKVIGDANSGPAVRVGISLEDCRHHVHVCGPTGTGKTSLLLRMILDDVEAGRGVAAFDPAAMNHARALLPGVEFAKDAYAAAKDADALVIVTEWDEFRALDLERLAKAMRGNVLVDLRNVYDRAEAEGAGFEYSGLGRGRLDGRGARLKLVKNGDTNVKAAR